jgi:hypothetical protein|tara:strand:+ start:495 stop:1022 length:528 start_codon:yes stop_codon:yes gene_type:complete
MSTITREELFEYLSSKGINPIHSTGIIANASRESSFIVDAEQVPNEDKGGKGLFQWEGPRYKGLKKYMKEKHGDENAWKDNWKSQVDYLFDEPVRESRIDRFFNEQYNTHKEAADGFMTHFERPKDKKDAMLKHEKEIKESEFYNKAEPMFGELGMLSEAMQLSDNNINTIREGY